MNNENINEQIEFLMSIYGFDKNEAKEYVVSLMDRRTRDEIDIMMGKPTIGVMPEWLWKEGRIDDLKSAIDRRYEAKLNIPKEWLDEFNKLHSELVSRNISKPNKIVESIEYMKDVYCDRGDYGE